MNKNIIIIFFLIFISITGTLMILFNTNDEKNIEKQLKKIGYNDKEIKKIIRQPEETKEIILKNEYNKKLINILISKNYQDDNLKLYLDYYNKHKNADINHIINIVNNDLFNEQYSPFLGKLASEKYFIKKNLQRYLAYENKNANETVRNVNCNIDYNYYEHKIKAQLNDDNLIIVNKYYYLDKNYEPNDLVTLPDEYNNGKNNKLRKIAYDAFIEMANASLLDNITIKNQSAYRSYNYQLNLYNNYVKKDGIKMADTYSARAGFSEHQTGLAVDINKVDISFENTEAFNWLSNNAYKYGFILRYPKNKENLTGYQYEPWHYRFVGIDVATKIYNENITYEEYYAYYVNKK